VIEETKIAGDIVVPPVLSFTPATLTIMIVLVCPVAGDRPQPE